MVYKKQFKKKSAAPYQDHLYESNSTWDNKNDKSYLKNIKKEGSQFNVISGFVTLFLVGAIIGLVLFESNLGKSSNSPE